MSLRGQLVFAIAVVLCTNVAARAQQQSVSMPAVRGNMIVTTDWLADHSRNPKIVVLHVGRDRTSYDAGHIPGARFVALGDIAVTRDGIPNELPPVADLQKTFERLGVGDDSRVILYGDLHGLLAARAYWTLDYLGHGDRAALLDGGIEKWRAEERPVTKEVPKLKPANFSPRTNPNVLVDAVEVERISKEASNHGSDSVLVDARPAEQFTGEQPGEGMKSGGHIPGAVSLPWTQNIDSTDNPELKPLPELRKLWSTSGAAPGKRVVVYCRTGMQASYEYFTAKFLGYDAAMYDGSMIDWTSRENAPVEGTKATASPKTNP